MLSIEKILKLYINYFPIEKGKSRIIEKYSDFIGLNGEMEYITQFGAHMQLDLSQYVQRQIYFRGQYEKYILALIKNLHEQHDFDFMIDVGANVGQHSLYAAVALGIPRILAFEPNRQTFLRLRTNLALNNIESQVTAYNLALSDIKSEIVMKKHFADNDGGDYICELGDRVANDNDDVIQAVVLDDYLDRIEVGSRGLMKIDVEGAEAKVIRGAHRLLCSGIIKALVVELCENHLQRFGQTSSCVVEELESLGMAGYIINKKGLTKLNHRSVPKFCEVLFVDIR